MREWPGPGPGRNEVLAAFASGVQAIVGAGPGFVGRRPFQQGGVSVGQAVGIAAFAWHVHAWDLHAWDLHAWDLHAWDLHAWDLHLAAGVEYYPDCAEVLRC